MPNEVTYNSAIEALDASNEFVRAELVFQSALRSEGVYANWLVQPPHSSALVLDLHRLPVAVARAAVMHTLGEMSQGGLQLPDPLIIVTGRGNHRASRYSRDEKRGVMRSSMISFLERLEIVADLSTDNAGRIIIEKDKIEVWLQVQEEDDRLKRSSGKAHGNLFLSVARAKKSKSGDVRAVCPFSSATMPTNTVGVSELAPAHLVERSPALQVKGEGCPAHNQDNIVELHAKTGSGSPCPAHKDEFPAPKAIRGVCPAHAKSPD